MKPPNSRPLAAACAALALAAAPATAQTLQDGASIGGAAPPLPSDAPPPAFEPLAAERLIEITVEAARTRAFGLAPVQLTVVGPAFRPESAAIRAHVEAQLAQRGVSIQPDAGQVLLIGLSEGPGALQDAFSESVRANPQALSAYVESLLSPRRTATEAVAANTVWDGTVRPGDAPLERSFAIIDGYGGNETGSAKVSLFVPFGASSAPTAQYGLRILLTTVEGEPLWQGDASGRFTGLDNEFAVQAMATPLIAALGETRDAATVTVSAPVPGAQTVAQ
ncbi:MAG: hypothetical protein AAF684_03725 [Pseudomonadota bacterium]